MLPNDNIKSQQLSPHFFTLQSFSLVLVTLKIFSDVNYWVYPLAAWELNLAAKAKKLMI